MGLVWGAQGRACVCACACVRGHAWRRESLTAVGSRTDMKGTTMNGFLPCSDNGRALYID